MGPSIAYSETTMAWGLGPEQEPYLNALGELLRAGALARVENEADRVYEIHGPDRTCYVALNPAKEFAGLLNSWPPDQPPIEVILGSV